MFPGLGIATVAFTAYVIADNLINPSSIDKLKEQAVKGAEGPTLWQAVTGNTPKARGEEE